jgi:hypothetical protein
MGQLDIYVRPQDKVKLIRKAKKMEVSLSKLMVRAALEYEGKLKED